MMLSTLRQVSLVGTCTLLFVINVVDATRSWKTIIDSNIYKRSNIDLARIKLRVEADPFHFDGDDHSSPPVSTSPPIETTQAPSPGPAATNHDEWITISPTRAPTLMPTRDPANTVVPSDWPSLAPSYNGPTMQPTKRESNVDGNGGCNPGSSLYRVNMHDTWGDGWDGTVLKIVGVQDQDEADRPLQSTITTTHTEANGGAVVTVSETIELHPEDLGQQHSQEAAVTVDALGLVFEGGLRSGSYAYTDVCLRPGRCYDLTVQGGGFLEEVSWDVRPVVLGAVAQHAEPIVQGGAPSDCSFSIPYPTGEQFCATTCSSTIDPDHNQSPQIFDNPLIDSVGGGENVARSSTTPAHVGLMNKMKNIEGGSRN